MVEEDFINKFRTVLDSLETKRGSVALFALFKMDDITDRWTIILAADWVTREDYTRIYTDLRKVSFEVLDERERAQIARIGIFPLNSHLVELTLDKFSGENREIRDEKINGNYIHYGYIFKAGHGGAVDAA